ncbi:MAG: nickel insertion protein, partial [Pirellulales bacterium]
DFPQPNILRLLLGTQAVAASSTEHRPHVESILVLETNLDDCPGDAIGHAMERLFAAGALDVAVTPIQMKKGRPGLLLSVQAQPADADTLEAILFQETTTLGVRRQQVLRTVLQREPHEVATSWGPIAGKIAYLPNGSVRFTPEYEACHRVSTEHGLPLADVLAAARQTFRAANT